MPSLTRERLVDILVKQQNISKQQAALYVTTLFSTMVSALVHNKELKLANFGRFQIRHKTARPGRNPITGDPVEVSARNVVVFYASRKIKQLLATLTD